MGRGGEGREGRESGGWEEIGGVRATEGGESERGANGGGIVPTYLCE